MEPYKAGMIKGNIFLKKKDVSGKMIALTDLTLDSRGLELIAPHSRAVLEHEIHELILTDEQRAEPSGTVNHIFVVGFFEVTIGGILSVGDWVFADKDAIGRIAGFDVTHMPNHMNIVIKTDKLSKPKLNLDQEIVISNRRP